MNGDQRGERVKIDSGQFLIGRLPDCDLQLQSKRVSRRHCVVAVDDTHVTVHDLGSRNGTIVNGREVRGDTYPLWHRDELEIGRWKFRVSLRDIESRAISAPDAPSGTPGIDATMAFEEIDDSDQQLSSDLLGELDQLTTQLEIPLKSAEVSTWREFESEPSVPTQPVAGNEGEPAHGASATNDPHAEHGDEPDADGSDSGSERKAPQRLPEHLRPKGPADSTNAADQALRRHFGR